MSSFWLFYASVHERKSIQKHQEDEPKANPLFGKAFRWETTNIFQDLAFMGRSQCDSQKRQKVRFFSLKTYRINFILMGIIYFPFYQTSKMGKSGHETRWQVWKNGFVLVHSLHSQKGNNTYTIHTLTLLSQYWRMTFYWCPPKKKDDEIAPIGLFIKRDIGPFHWKDKKEAET